MHSVKKIVICFQYFLYEISELLALKEELASFKLIRLDLYR